MKIKMPPLAALCCAIALAAAAPAAAGDAGNAEMIEKMMALMKPSQGHARLAKMAGTWDAVMKMWEPGAEPVETTGTLVAEMILGGRYLKGTFKARIRDQSFEGVQVAGYDNYRKQYNSLWIDNFGTAFNLSTGTCDDQGTCTYKGSWDDPTTGGTIPLREVITWRGDNSYTYEMYQSRGGKEHRVMQITYTRRP